MVVTWGPGLSQNFFSKVSQNRDVQIFLSFLLPPVWINIFKSQHGSPEIGNSCKAFSWLSEWSLFKSQSWRPGKGAWIMFRPSIECWCEFDARLCVPVPPPPPPPQRSAPQRSLLPHHPVLTPEDCVRLWWVTVGGSRKKNISLHQQITPPDPFTSSLCVMYMKIIRHFWLLSYHPLLMSFYVRKKIVYTLLRT